MGKIQPDVKIQSGKDVVWKIIDGDAILLDLKSGNYFGLNETGLRIWKHTNGKRTVKEIATLLVQELGIPPESANRDATKFFDNLFRHKLIETV